MRLALELAKGAQGQTGVNPMVGCVIVRDGRIVGTGAHLRMGSAHAEVHAIRMAGDEAEGSTVYVTLEPCSHHGRTPPCCELLIASRVAKVVVAATDPNPQVAGSGISRLREAGIEVAVGLLEQEARELNEVFNKYIVTGLPFVTLKTASTLDGKIASKSGDSRWITNEASREFVHTLRHRHQAIMVGVGTVLADNPSLTTRLPVPALDPLRVIIDSRLRTPPDARVLHKPGRALIITTEEAAVERRMRLEQNGAEVIAAGAGPEVDLTLAMKLLGERQISSILLEGGGRINGAMLELGLIDKCYLFYAPKIIGGEGAPSNFQFPGQEKMADAVSLRKITVEMFDDNICLVGYPEYQR
nr:bifunctional diaminohydroxyphosphoribosylaminopyrimidine deaminase/5-amino-6-(5-phosphoribosylamino)uracil reductase RibD [Paenibacillus senegalensis]